MYNRLNFSRRHLKDDLLPHLKRELPQGRGSYLYEEVDFSQNELSATGLSLVLDVCRRCPKLRVLKLYKNQIDDGGAEGLADLCKKLPEIEEIHLSHNHFTAVGVEVLVTAAEQARPNNVSPLWLRLEHNDVADPDAVYRELSSRISVCNRMDEVRCTVRVCAKKQKVHLPFFHLQRSTRLRDGPPPGPLPGASPTYRVPRDEAGSPVYHSSGVTPKHGMPANRVPGPMNPPSRSVVNTPKSGTTATPNGTSAWDVSGANAARRFLAQNAASSGTGPAPPPPSATPGGGAPGGGVPGGGVPGTGAQQAASTGTLGTASAGPGATGTAATSGGSRWTDQSQENPSASPTQQGKASEEQQPQQAVAQRPSLVLDPQGRRRILRKQLVEADNSQFICELCHFVILRPQITCCSHMFCETCFRNWVSDQVDKQKKSMPGNAQAVPLIKCPQQKCPAKLRRSDIGPLDKADGAKGSNHILQRMRNNLQIRCVHHVEHFKYAFGADAKRVQAETGLTCTWVGDLPVYEEHVCKSCPVEAYLGGPPEGCGSAENGRSPAASPTPQLSGPSPKPGAAVPAVEQSGAKAASAAKPSASAARSGNAGGAGAEAATAQKQPEPAVQEELAGETRVVKYDYDPRETDESQIPLRQNDHVKVFEVTDSGWAAGVRLCRNTGQELGAAGWFPATYLYPRDHRDAAATA